MTSHSLTLLALWVLVISVLILAHLHSGYSLTTPWPHCTSHPWLYCGRHKLQVTNANLWMIETVCTSHSQLARLSQYWPACEGCGHVDTLYVYLILVYISLRSATPWRAKNPDMLLNHTAPHLFSKSTFFLVTLNSHKVTALHPPINTQYVYYT